MFYLWNHILFIFKDLVYLYFSSERCEYQIAAYSVELEER